MYIWFQAEVRYLVRKGNVGGYQHKYSRHLIVRTALAALLLALLPLCVGTYHGKVLGAFVQEKPWACLFFYTTTLTIETGWS